MRLLPVASCVAISSILGTKLAVRLGTKLVVASGLFLMAAFYVWVSTSSASTGYGTIAAQMVVLGTGMGLTSAPATEAIMGVVPKAKAGVGSAVNDATRLLGGTLGVAVIGSVYASLYASRLTSALPAGCRPPSIGPRTHRSAPRSPPQSSSATPATRRSRRRSMTPPSRPSSTASRRQLRRRRRCRRGRRDGAGAAARPPDGQRDDAPRDTRTGLAAPLSRRAAEPTPEHRSRPP